jgi:hypothetical protein
LYVTGNHAHMRAASVAGIRGRFAFQSKVKISRKAE